MQATTTTKIEKNEDPDISKFVNSSLRPSEVEEYTWLYICNRFLYFPYVGRWVLPCKKNMLDNYWSLATKSYENEQLDGVISIKCTTYGALNTPNKDDSGAEGMLIFHCANSDNKLEISNIGKRILCELNYREVGHIKYVVDMCVEREFMRDRKINVFPNLYSLRNPYYNSEIALYRCGTNLLSRLKYL